MVTENGRRTRIDVSDSELEFLGQAFYDFRLRARCRDRSYRRLFGTTVFLDVVGSLARSEGETRVVFKMRSGTPGSIGWWVLQALWHGVMVTTLAALVGGAFLSGRPQLWQLAGGATLAFALLYGILGLGYAQSVRATTTLIERALAAFAESAPEATIVLQR